MGIDSMLVDEAKVHKDKEFEKVRDKIVNLVVECEGLYRSLLKYNDMITYEELYDLSGEDVESFNRIRDRAHEIEHSLLHCRADLMDLIDGDVEWFLTDDDCFNDENYFDDLKSSDIFFDCFRLEISLALLFDKLKQLNVPRKTDSHLHLHVHKGGGCC